MREDAPLLVDSMIVIEAVRTGVWSAITGQRTVITVRECGEELLRGDSTVLDGYVPVGAQHLERLRQEPVTDAERLRFQLHYPAADGLDPGERDLLILATSMGGRYELCSCDKAAVMAAHALGMLDQTVSLQSVIEGVGVRPNPSLRVQYTEERMRQWRTQLKLGMRI